MAYETVPFRPDSVLRVIRSRGERGIVWSAIAAAILGVDRASITIAQVRGVRNTTRWLQEEGLVRSLGEHYPGSLVFVAN